MTVLQCLHCYTVMQSKAKSWPHCLFVTSVKDADKLTV